MSSVKGRGRGSRVIPSWMVRTSKLEKQVYAVEGIRIIVRVERDEAATPYKYQNKAISHWDVGRWISHRVEPHVPYGAEIEVLDPRHGRLYAPRDMSVQELRRMTG